MKRRHLAVLATVTSVLALFGDASAQGWTLDVHAGQSSFDHLPPEARATSAALGLRHSLDERFFHAALAAPLSSDDVAWGAMSGGDRFAVRSGRVEAGLDLGAQGHAQRDLLGGVSGWGLRGEALAMASVSAGPFVAEARGGRSWYHADVDGTGWSRNLWMSDLRVTVVPAAAPFQLFGTVRQLRAPEGTYEFVGATAMTMLSRVSLRGSLGSWVSGLPDDARSYGWGMAGAVAVSPTVDLWTSIRSEPFDPGFLAGSRTTWGIGVSYRLGADDRPRAPRAGPEVRTGGDVVVRLPVSASSSPPWVAGDFTGWEPIRMHRRGTEWRAEISVPAGVYRYAFRTGEDEWFVPEGVPGRRDDGMGGWVAVLVVP